MVEAEWGVCFCSSGGKCAVVDAEVGIGGVFGDFDGSEIGDFEDAVEVEVFERFFINGRPVGKSAGETADVDEVEGVCVRPFFLRVVDFEEEVGRHVGGLETGDIRSHNFGVGEFLGHGDGPVAGTCSDVEDTCGGAGDVLEGELAVEDGGEALVGDGDAGLFLLVTGHEVGFICVGTAVFEDLLEYTAIVAERLG